MASVDEVAFQYRLRESGWAEVTFIIGRSSVALDAGFVGDPLDGLLRAALAIAADQHRTDTYWQATDGDRYWWELTRASEFVHVEVVELWTRGTGGQQGGVLLAGDCLVTALCVSLAEGTRQVYSRHGLRGYRHLTSTPFPAAALADLEAVAVSLTL